MNAVELSNHYYLEAEAALAEDDCDTAETYICKALELDPETDRGEKFRILAGVYVEQENYANAQRAFAIAAECLPDDPWIRIDMVDLYEFQGMFSEAEDCLEQAALLAEAAHDEDAAEAVETRLKQLEAEKAEISDTDDSPDSLTDEFESVTAKDIEKDCREKLADDPDNPQLLKDLAHSLMDQGREDEAIEYLERICANNDQDAEAMNALGACYHDCERVNDALRCYEDALHLDPEYSQSRCNIAIHNIEEGRYDEALALVDHGLAFIESKPVGELYESDVQLYYLRAVALIEKGSTFQACTYLKDVIDSFPQDAKFWAYYGQALYEEDRAEEAESAYERAVALDPDNFDCLIAYADILACRGKYDEALTCLADAEELLEEDLEMQGNEAWTIAVFHARAEIFFEMHSYEDALQEARKARAVNAILMDIADIKVEKAREIAAPDESIRIKTVAGDECREKSRELEELICELEDKIKNGPGDDGWGASDFGDDDGPGDFAMA